MNPTHMKPKADPAARGTMIQKVLEHLTTAVPHGDAITRRSLVASVPGADSQWMYKVIQNLARAGVLQRHYTSHGNKGGVTAAYSVDNWEEVDVVLGSAPLAVYKRWVLNPPSRRVPARKRPAAPAASHATEQEQATLTGLPIIGTPAPKEQPGRKLAKIAYATKVLGDAKLLSARRASLVEIAAAIDVLEEHQLLDE